MHPKHCILCNDDFYNGKNGYGIEECWNLKKAKIILRRRVHVNERPPWTREPEKLPNCYRQKGFVFVDPELNK
jgi:hypothetical protein